MSFDINNNAAPSAEIRPSISTHHGIELTDNYAWLRADNWQDVMRAPSTLPADIKTYLDAENAYYQALMADTTGFQDTLFDEMKGRIKQDDHSVPSLEGIYAYSSLYQEGDEYPLYIRTARKGGSETILFNGPIEAENHEYFSLGLMDHSPDHRRLAWSLDDNGSEFHHMRIRDLDTGIDDEEVIKDVGSFSWASDSLGFVYVKVDENHRPNKVYYKAPDAEAVLIYEENDPRFYISISKSLDGKWFILHTGQNDEDEVRLFPSDNPRAEMMIVSPRRENHEYSVDTHGDTLFITTNSGGAENFRIMTANISKPGESNWEEVIPHRKDVLLVSSFVYKAYLVRLERENALPSIVIRRLKDGMEHTINFDEEAYSLGIQEGYEFDTQILRFTYSSPSTPNQTWDYNLDTQERILRQEQEIPSGHDAQDYVVRRLHAPSNDGELVPLTVVHHRNTPIDGSAPCLLYGYGSYGAGMPASFSSNRLSLVDRGMIYCIAHIRGGDEKGREWYEQTKKAGKPKTFQDFIASGKFLALKGFTSEGKIVAMGGSAGGLLMGAVANMAPQMFAGIIAQVPFVDVLNTMLDASLPLTPGEWSQWGNPIESVEEYKIIEGYSPYDNVTAQKYPPIFALSGLTDPRVQYWEPSKWVAKLREATQGKSAILLKTNMGSGHFGKTGRFAYLEEVAMVYAFALKAANKI